MKVSFPERGPVGIKKEEHGRGSKGARGRDNCYLDSVLEEFLEVGHVQDPVFHRVAAVDRELDLVLLAPFPPLRAELLSNRKGLDLRYVSTQEEGKYLAQSHKCA